MNKKEKTSLNIAKVFSTNNIELMILTNTGEISISGIASDGSGKVVCIKSDGNLGTCSSIIDITGLCTCG